MGFEQALGGLLTGGVEGYRTGIKMQQEADKAKREQEMHESTLKNQEQQRKATGLQIDKGNIELKRAKDEEAMRTQISNDTQALMNASMGGVSGDVMDNQGNPVAKKTLFGDDATIQKQMREQGIEFVPGSITKIGPMDEFTKHRAMTDIMTKARFDHGLMDENALKMVFENNKNLKNEGIEEGTRQFLLNGDSDAALAMFNKSGAIKAEKGMFLRRVQDDKTGIPDVAVYKPGKDGHPELVTTMNQYLTMTTSAGLQNYLSTRLEEMKQGHEDSRNAATNATHRDVAAMNNSTHLQVAEMGRGSKKDQLDAQIKQYVLDLNEKVAGNTANANDVDQYRQNVFDQVTMVRKLIAEGKAADVPEAASMAFKALRGSTPQSALRNPPPKK